jgi:hypothetical protein
MENLILAPATVITIVTLLLISLALIAVFLYLMYIPLRTIFKKNKSLTRFSSCLKCIEDFDELMVSGNTDAAIPRLQMAPFLDIPANSQILAAIKDHHQELLSRYLQLSDSLNVRSPNLASLENLFHERNELLELVFKSRFNYEVLADKRKNEGKTLPGWTRAEFDKKEADLKNALKKNFTSLKTELHYFFKHLEETPRGEILIH